jgi:predicted sugar kinase
MPIEITAPACLLLGLAQVEGQTCQLAITLQYPPIQLLARESAALAITGGRADLARRQAERFFERHRLPQQAEIEIELAIPQFMGLGSAAMLGLSVARALAVLHGQPAEVAALASALGLTSDEALEARAFAQGGLLLVDGAGGVRRRHEIAHHNEDDDWVFVLVLPHVAAGTPATLEADLRRALSASARNLSAETGDILGRDLWPALEHDDIAQFARALMALQALNQAALADAGQPLHLSTEEQAILEIMRAGDALAWGRTIAGLGLYGLIKGGGPSRALRRALTAHVGYFGGTVMATLCDNRGARLQGPGDLRLAHQRA